MKTLRSAGYAALALLIVTIAGAMTQGPGQQRQRRTLPGDLTKPIEQYTGDEFFALVTRLNYVGGRDRVRRCRGLPGCQQTVRTNVRIDAIETEDSLSAGDLPQFGVIAARAIVRGNETEAMYGMLPSGPTGRYMYFLIVTRNGAGGASWRLEQLSVQGTTRTHSLLTQGTFRACNHAFVRGARADFRTCADAGASAVGPTRFLNASFSAGAQGVEPPIWIGCASGCCTADGT